MSVRTQIVQMWWGQNEPRSHSRRVFEPIRQELCFVVRSKEVQLGTWLAKYVADNTSCCRDDVIFPTLKLAFLLTYSKRNHTRQTIPSRKSSSELLISIVLLPGRGSR